jgi:hypothetical protein
VAALKDIKKEETLTLNVVHVSGAGHYKQTILKSCDVEHYQKKERKAVCR